MSFSTLILTGAYHFLERKIRLHVSLTMSHSKTEQERQELEQCSRRIAELLYQEAREQDRPVSDLGSIEFTIRAQLQEYVSPTIGAFFVKPSAARPKDIVEP